MTQIDLNKNSLIYLFLEYISKLPFMIPVFWLCFFKYAHTTGVTQEVNCMAVYYNCTKIDMLLFIITDGCGLSRLPWEQLFEPVVNISRDGFQLTEHGGFVIYELLSSLLLP